MKHFQVFNPEHDMALANGDKHFIAPKNIREMARDLKPLLEAMQCRHPLVWGWDTAIKEQLHRQGIPADELPTEAALAALRTHSERKMAHWVLHAFRADKPDGPYTGESCIIHHTDEIEPYATRHRHIVLKDPLSSSGKGLRHVNMNEGGLPLPCPQAELLWEDKSSVVATDAHLASAQRGGTEGASSLSSSLSKIENWANALIKRHGYLTAEPYYHKMQDFAMEFQVIDGQCHFIGYSLFMTNPHGRYEESILMEDEKIEEQLAQYVPRTALHELREWIIAHCHCIIPEEWDTTSFPLYFGIDMMVVKTTDKVAFEREQRLLADSVERSNFNEVNEQQTTDATQKTNFQFSILNSQFRIHPCVEINLRLNMGIIAHEVRRHILAPQTEGTFHVVAFPTTEALKTFQREHTQNFPAVYQNGNVVSGYHPLTPIAADTRHHAYIICKQKELR